MELLRDEGYDFIFLDESFLDQNHHPHASLVFTDETGQQIGAGRPSKGRRLCFIDAVCALGLIPGLWRVLKPKSRGAATEDAKRRTTASAVLHSSSLLIISILASATTRIHVFAETFVSA